MNKLSFQLKIVDVGLMEKMKIKYEWLFNYDVFTENES